MAKYVAVVIVALAAFGATHSGTSSGVMPLPDLALRETTGGLQLFVAVPNRGPLLSATVPAGRRLVPLSAFSNATPCGVFERPVGVALRDARLVVVQAEPVPIVRECNLESRETRVLLQGEPLRAPASVAIASDGTVAVIDRALRAIVAIGRTEKPTVVRVSESPSIIRADDIGQLYVVDLESKGIIQVRLARSSFLSSSPAQQTAGRANGYLPLSTEPSSFAVFKDVFYVLDANGPAKAQLAGGRLSLEIPEMRPREAAAAASLNYLATLDRDASSVSVIDRPLPAGVVLDPLRGNPNEAWLQLLEYLSSRQMLSRDRVQLSGEATYEDALRRNGVLVKVDVHPEKVAVAPGRAKALFCALNQTICSTGYSADLPYVVIPQAAPQPELQAETRPLDNKPVKDWVEESVLLSGQLREVNEAYLASRNPGVASSLETELSRRQMIVATPMSDRLTAGTIIRLAAGREEVVGSLDAACPDVNGSISKTSLITDFSAPRAAIPPDAAPVGTGRVRMSVGVWTRSAVPAAALQKCRPAEGAPDQFLITESLGALDVRFSAADAAGEGATVPGPLYVGYKAVPLAALSAGVTIPILDPERLKPLPESASSELWARASGSFTLPVTRWRADILVPRSDFYNSGGALRQILKSNPGLTLSPRERLDKAAYSAALGNGVGRTTDTAEDLEKARMQLAKIIQYDAALADASGSEDVVIGVVEQSGGVNLDHPAFAAADGQSAWNDFIQGSGLLQPHRPTLPAGTPTPVTVRRVNADLEHGNHVAGTMAARRPPALTLGLLPKVRLFLVPSDSMADLRDNIQRARDLQVSLFNMSLGFTAATPSEIMQELHEQIRDGWSDLLFVVAAGNDGVDLNAASALPPAAWSATVPNVIVVGASDEKGDNVLGQHQDGTDPVEPHGSNFGSRYVDLLAPGQMIYSLGRDGYTYGCGSSHAAPQVTAAAAMLWQLFLKPDIIRARLIYTADWKKPNFDKKVWGGLLNVRRAVFAPKKNVFVRFGADETPHEIKLEVGASVKIRGNVQKRDGTTAAFLDAQFPFSRVLRMTALSGGTYRVALLVKSTSVLEFVEGTVTGNVLCKGVKQFDPGTQTFSIDPNPAVDCQQGINVGQFKEYVAAAPGSVKFQ